MDTQLQVSSSALKAAILVEISKFGNYPEPLPALEKDDPPWDEEEITTERSLMGDVADAIIARLV